MTAVITADPKQLVEAYKQGDAQAFDEIVRCYYEGLFTHALRRLGDAHAAEDAVQETLVRAYGALHRFNGQYHLRAWLHRILSNVCHDEGARRQRELRTVERAAGAEVDVVDEIGEDLIDRLAIPRLQVLDALAALPEPYRRALVLRYVDDLSFREVAEATGVTEGNARARVHRARAALKRTLGASLAMLAWLVPVLRRAERTAAADAGPSVHAGLAASHATPVFTRAIDAGLAERVASLAGSLGIAASLAVPVGVSQVADQVKPPAPAVVEVQAAAAPPAAADGTGSASADRPSVTTRTTLRAAASPASTSPTTAAPATGTGSNPAGDPAPLASGVLPSRTGTGTTGEDGSGTAVPGGPGAAPAPSPSKTFLIESNELSATTSWRTDLAGRVRLKVGDQPVVGNLVGVLEAEPRQAPASDSNSGSPTGASTTSSQPSSTTTTQAPPPQPRSFTSDLTVRLDDGRVLRFRVAGTLTDSDAGARAAGEARVFDELCGVELGVARLGGSLALREAPLMSSMAISGDGVALAEAATSRSDCGAATKSGSSGVREDNAGDGAPTPAAEDVSA